MTMTRREIRNEMHTCRREKDLLGFELLARSHPDCLYTDDGWDYWLRNAAGDGDLPLVQLLVRLGVDVNLSSGTFIPDDTAVGSAAMHGHLEVVKWLLEHGAKLNFIAYGAVRSALTDAIDSGNFELVKLLVERGADVNATGLATTPLGSALQRPR